MPEVEASCTGRFYLLRSRRPLSDAHHLEIKNNLIRDLVPIGNLLPQRGHRCVVPDALRMLDPALQVFGFDVFGDAGWIIEFRRFAAAFAVDGVAGYAVFAKMRKSALNLRR